MTILDGEVRPLGGLIQAAEDYRLFNEGKMSSGEYYRRHPDEIPEFDPAKFTADTPENRKIKEWADRILKRHR